MTERAMGCVPMFYRINPRSAASHLVSVRPYATAGRIEQKRSHTHTLHIYIKIVVFFRLTMTTWRWHLCLHLLK